MSIVMLNAYNSLGNNFNEFLKFLKIKHNDNEWFLKAMQNSKVIKFIPGFHDQVYRDSLGKSGAYAKPGKNCFKWCCILPGARLHIRGMITLELKLKRLQLRQQVKSLSTEL